MNTAEKWHGTTIVLLRKNGETVVAGDGQVSLGNTVLKSKAKKVRKIESRGVIAGFAGSTADALTLFERLEAKLEKHAGNLQRAAVELAKDWRSDKFMSEIDSSGVFHNCSTRFADGFRYGFGAEVGISTQTLPPRGPVGLEGLVTYKYFLRGEGHIVEDFSSGKLIYSHKDV